MRIAYCAVVFVCFFAPLLVADDVVESDIPDWIPVGAVSPPVMRRSTEARARIQTRDPQQQRAALTLLKTDIERYGRAEMRIAAVPLVAELLSQDYHILGFPDDYRVETTIRLSALDVLAAVGGEPARTHIRYSVVNDDDGAVRSHAARLLATVPGSDPDGDLAVVARSLLSAVKVGGNEAEVYRTLEAARLLTNHAWSPEVPELIRALVLIYEGNFSRGVRRSAIALLEELANR